MLKGRSSIKSITVEQGKDNTFCGPAVLAGILGVTTNEIAAEVTKLTGRASISWMTYPEIQEIFRLHNVRTSYIKPTGSLYWTISTLGNGVFVIMVPGHFVVIEKQDKDVFFFDNHTKKPINALASARLMQAVKGIMKVEIK